MGRQFVLRLLRDVDMSHATESLELQDIRVTLRVGRLVDRLGHVFVLALDNDEERIQCLEVYSEQGSTAQCWVTLD